MRRLLPLLPVLLPAVLLPAACTVASEPPAATTSEPLLPIEVPPDPLADFRDLDQCAILDLVEESEASSCTRLMEKVDRYHPRLELRFGEFIPDLRGEQETIDLGDDLVAHADECTPYGRTFDVPLVEGHGLRFRFWAMAGTHTTPPQEWVDEHLCAAVPDLLRQLEPALRELPRHPEGALADPCAVVPALTDLVGGGEANRQNRHDADWWRTIDLCEAVGPLGKVAVRYQGDHDRPRFAPDSTLSGRPVSVDHHGNERQNCSLVWYQRNRAEEGSEGLVTVAVGLLSDDNPPTRPFEADPCVEVAKAATAVMEELDR